MTFELANKVEKYFNERGFESAKKVCDEALVGVRMLPCFCMILLEHCHHVCSEQMHIILKGRPEDNRIKLLLQVMDFDNSFWFAYIKHLPRKERPL